ncbi:DMT family transporter [Ruegeria litorea]|nr:DMT family transporter [Falsiruegeria litorea]
MGNSMPGDESTMTMWPIRSEMPPSAVYLRLTLTAALWAGTFVAGRVVALELPPLPIAIGRFGIAVVALYLWARWTEGGLPRLSLRQLMETLLLGLTGVCLYNLFFLVSLSEMPASRTATFVALNPVVVSLLMFALFRERLSLKRWAGIGLTLAGAILVISRGNLTALAGDIESSFGRGEVAMSMAVLSWALYTIIGRNALKGLSPLSATTYAAIWGLVLLVSAYLAMPAPDIQDAISARGLAAIVYLAIGGTVVPFLWYYRGVSEIGPARTSVFTNLVPVFGVLFGVVLLGEPLLMSMIVGGGLVVAGVILTNRT